MAANLTILKSPTVLRQADGRLWCWEGCCDGRGCCHGSCTHVWNYAQAMPHLFPSLERTLRETEFRVSQDDRGHQTFRAALPIRPPAHDFHAAADGQLGGIMKVYREWRISRRHGVAARPLAAGEGEPRLLHRDLGPATHRGASRSPTTTPTTSSSGARTACARASTSARCGRRSLMGEALGDDVAALRGAPREGPAAHGDGALQRRVLRPEGRVEGPARREPPGREEHGRRATRRRPVALLDEEGPKYQYGDGCLSDGVLGEWMAAVCGVGEVLDRAKTAEPPARGPPPQPEARPLRSRQPAAADVRRAATEGGLLLCTWPRGGALALPFVYCNEVWTGIEYQVASHLMLMGMVEEGLEIVRACRDRYDGRVRNPFNEYECGHWYARAMSCYGLLQGLTGRALRRGRAGPPPRAAPARGFPELPVHGDRLRHGRA